MYHAVKAAADRAFATVWLPSGRKVTTRYVKALETLQISKPIFDFL